MFNMQTLTQDLYLLIGKHCNILYVQNDLEGDWVTQHEHAALPPSRG